MQNKSNRCKAENKNGRSCRAAATVTGYCFIHSNPGIAKELGRAGGRKNRRFGLEPRAVPALSGASGVRNAAEQAIADLYGAKLSPREATALASLLNILDRTVSADLLQEMKTLQEKVRALEAGSVKEPTANQGSDTD